MYKSHPFAFVHNFSGFQVIPYVLQSSLQANSKTSPSLRRENCTHQQSQSPGSTHLFPVHINWVILDISYKMEADTMGPFASGFFHLACFQGLSVHLCCTRHQCAFSWLYTIPLYRAPTFCSSSHQLMNTRVGFCFVDYQE